jgi:hypothetical protein
MVGRILLGFLAAALAVLIAHQGMIGLLNAIGWLPNKPFNMEPIKNAPPQLAALMTQAGFKGWPTLFNLVFWGGLWGALFAVINPWLPGRAMVLKGLLFGVLIQVFNWTGLPLIKGGAFFSNFEPMRMLIGLLIQSAFGLGIGLFYGLFRRT